MVAGTVDFFSDSDKVAVVALSSSPPWAQDLAAMYRSALKAVRDALGRAYSLSELARLASEGSSLPHETCLWLLNGVEPQFNHLLESPAGWRSFANIAGLGDASFSVRTH